MKTESLIGHTSEIVRIMRKSSQPADAVMSEYLRARKYVGARDRRFISGLAFYTLRILSVAEALAKHKQIDDVAQAAYELCGGEPTDNFELNTDDAWLSSLPVATRVCTQEWLLHETGRRWKDDAADVWQSMMHSAPVGLRVNLRRTTRDKVLKALRDENISCDAGVHASAAINVHQRINVLQHPLYEEGFVEIQDEGSQLIALACAAQKGMHILDACAGAGGKTLHLADIINDTGTIIAQDIEWQRLKQVPFRARRAGIKCITVQTVQGNEDTVPRSARNDSDDRPRGVPRFTRNDAASHAFDLVLVDAPCSGLGTVRRMPMPKWRLTMDQAKRYARKQLLLLSRNASRVRSGGALVYSTCSILPTENEDIIDRFLKDHPNFTLEFQQQYDPYHHQTDGLFVARLRLA